MPCSNENYLGYSRMMICQSEKISVDTNCSSPTFSWTPGGFTTQEVNLQAEVEHEVVVGCDNCGDDQVLDYCIPIILSGCSDPNPPYNTLAFYFTCDSGNSQTITQQAFIEKFTCTGDDAVWTGVEFDLTHVPTGITATFPGGSNDISVTVDYAFVYPGTYYIPTRVQVSSGRYSNWALLIVNIDLGNCCS